MTLGFSELKSTGGMEGSPAETCEVHTAPSIIFLLLSTLSQLLFVCYVL